MLILQFSWWWGCIAGLWYWIVTLAVFRLCRNAWCTVYAMRTAALHCAVVVLLFC
jgi:hypothetical protein